MRAHCTHINVMCIRGILLTFDHWSHTFLFLLSQFQMNAFHFFNIVAKIRQ